MKIYSVLNVIRMWKSEISYNGTIQYNYISGILTLYVTRPDYFIGREKRLLAKYKQIMQENFEDFKDIKFVQTCPYYEV